MQSPRKRNRYTLILFAFLSFWTLAHAEKTLIYLENSERLSFDEEKHPDCQILQGDVRFRHDDVLMFCDTAYFYSSNNNIDAYGNIRINQGDTLTIYGDKLLYDGNTKLARLRDNVRMVNQETTLTTDSLNFDRLANIGYYFSGGTIVDSTNILVSELGKYFPNTKIAIFQKEVTLTNPQFVLYSDTLKYNTNSKIADILGPSTILYDSTTVYSEYGWYDTANEYAELLQASSIKDTKGRTLYGDSLFYNRKIGLATGINNVELRDSSRQILLQGNHGHFTENNEAGFMTQKATLINFKKNDSDSLFVTADTVFYQSNDSITSVRGNYNVQGWHNDFQVLADSMYYSNTDSTLYLYERPVIWSGENQIIGDEMRILMVNNEIDQYIAEGSAFVFSGNEVDSIAYNQLSGKKITGYLEEGKLHKIDVSGNAMSIVFATEEEQKNKNGVSIKKDSIEYVGVNHTESSKLMIYLGENNELKKTVMTPASNGTLYPPKRINDKQVNTLRFFIDYRRLRPENKSDIYFKKDKKSIEDRLDTMVKKRRKRKVKYAE